MMQAHFVTCIGTTSSAPATKLLFYHTYTHCQTIPEFQEIGVSFYIPGIIQLSKRKMVRTTVVESRCALLVLMLHISFQGTAARLPLLNGGLAFVSADGNRRRRHRNSPSLSRLQSNLAMAPKAIITDVGGTTNGVKVDNEWGIPDSETLEPLSPVPLEELPNGGRITLVGAGPGDPELLTMSAYRLLRDPDVMVIADRLVSDEILDLIASQDVKVARKMPGCADLAQEEIYWWAHRGIQEGKHVVRLKIGDPFVFGRGGEEVLKFRSFGVESKVIPVRCVVQNHVPRVLFALVDLHLLERC